MNVVKRFPLAARKLVVAAGIGAALSGCSKGHDKLGPEGQPPGVLPVLEQILEMPPSSNELSQAHEIPDGALVKSIIPIKISSPDGGKRLCILYKGLDVNRRNLGLWDYCKTNTATHSPG
ncbi:MAG: hypothetical protein SFW62_08740 [Alphaproteobacteria bacterium]|nr:hypothetical protein [Alphaproteobacteria bacterium]